MKPRFRNSVLIPLQFPCKWSYGSPFFMMLSFPIYVLELYSANLIDPIGPSGKRKKQDNYVTVFGIVERFIQNIVLWKQLSTPKITLLQLEIWKLQYLNESFLVGLFPTILIAWQLLLEYVHWSKICQTSIHPTASIYACMHVGTCKFAMG